MKTFLCASACVLLLTGGAAAKDSMSHATHAKAHRMHKPVRAVRPAQPARKDPYAKYWDDPTRYQGFSYRGDVR